MKLCDYGCEKEAKYKLGNGKNCCCEKWNSCIKNREKFRNKKLGDKNPSKRLEVRERIRNTVTNLWGDPNSFYRTEEMRNRMRCSRHSDEFKESQRQRILNGSRDDLKSPEILKRRKDTRIKLGQVTPDENLSELDLYTKIVWKYTNSSLKQKYTNDELKQRGQKKEKNHKQVDHIFSIHGGFKNGILPMIMGSTRNIKLVDCSYNKSKHSKCDISKEELFQRYYEDK